MLPTRHVSYDRVALDQELQRVVHDDPRRGRIGAQDDRLERYVDRTTRIRRTVVAAADKTENGENAQAETETLHV